MGTRNENAMRWDGAPGHYEVHYVTATDTTTRTGLWIRLTMRAPLEGPPECSLWFIAMQADGERHARKATFGIDRLESSVAPFRLQVGDAVLTDDGCTGHMEKAAWDLSWTGEERAWTPVNPLLARSGIAQTVFTLPHPDLRISGTVSYGGRTLQLDGAHGGQAHLWGNRHAERWVWLHASELLGADGVPRPGDWLEGVSVIVERAGRPVGPNTLLFGRILGEEWAATGPVAILRTRSQMGLTSWRFEATSGSRRLIGTVDAPRETLAQVTYHDPDGRPAYCCNSELATLRLQVWDRTARGRFGWTLRETLSGPERSHFEYAQREPVPAVELLTT